MRRIFADCEPVRWRLALKRAGAAMSLVVVAALTVGVSRVKFPAEAEPLVIAPTVDQRIVAALDHRISVDFDQTPFRLALKQIAGQLPRDLRIPCRLDAAAIEAEFQGVDPGYASLVRNGKIDLDVPVSLWAKEARFSSVLSRLVRRFGLDWTLTNEGLLISTREVVAQTYFRRDYDLTAIVRRPAEKLFQEPKKSEDGMIAALIRLLKEHFPPDGQSPVPNAWYADGCPIDVHKSGSGYVLAITQTRAAHEQISATLRGLSSGARENENIDWQRYRTALGHRFTLDVQEAPFNTVVRQIERALPPEMRLPIDIDRNALLNGGNAENTPVTFRMTDGNLRGPFGLLLNRMNLAWVFRDEAVLVTTMEQADTELFPVAYNVTDLLWAPDGPPRSEPRRIRMAGRGERLAQPTGTLAYLLQTETAPSTWESVGGAGRIHGFTGDGCWLVVSQTIPVHAQIAGVLYALRQTVDKLPPGTTVRKSAEASVRAIASPEEPAFQKRVAAARAHRVSCDFDNVPLSEAFLPLEKSLPAAIRIPFVLDAVAMDDNWREPSVSLHARDIAFGDAMSHLFRQAGLAWLAKNDILLVTTPEKADSEWVLQVYNVSDLVGPRKPRGERGFRDSMDDLIDLITTTVAPTTWEEVGGPASWCSEFRINGMRLVVRQTPAVHAQIADLFGQLRSAALDAEPSANEQRLTAALNYRLSVDWKAVPLREARQVLQDAVPAELRIPLLLEEKSLEDAGIPSDARVTLCAANVRMRSALALMLRPLDLGWFRKDGVLLVASREKCQAELITRVYNVDDLVSGPPERRATMMGARRRLEDVSELCKNVLSPNTWDAVGGPGAIAQFSPQGKRHSLVVSQTALVQEEIRNLLAEMRGRPYQPGPLAEADYIVSADDRKRFETTLDQPVSADFDQVPLTRALDALSLQLPESMRVSFVLDRRGIADSGDNAEEPVSMHLKNAPLRQVLPALLAPLELDYRACHDVFCVAPRSLIEGYCEPRIYDVTDLTGESFIKLDEVLQAAIDAAPPESWVGAGGPGTASVAKLDRAWLAIQQTPRIHEQIARRLQELREP